jgi:hypothetical protein
MLRFRLSREGTFTDLLVFIVCLVLLLSALIVSPPPSLATNGQALSLKDHPKSDPPAANLPNLDKGRRKRQPEPDLQLQVLLVWAGQQPYKAVSPEQVTRQFYGWYLGARFPNPKRSNMATFRKYVTQSFLKRATAPDVDAVLFIDAQDTDPTWADNFTVSKATIRGQRAAVQVALNGKQMRYSLHVTLRREGGGWKIDDVKGSNA